MDDTRASNRFLLTTLLIGIPAVSLFMTPNYSSEPIDLPKMFLLAPLGFASLFFAALSTEGPPGCGNRSNLAVLSKASPKESSIVVASLS